MNKTVYSIIAAAAAALTAATPARASEPWTLDSCITYAVQHNIDVERSRLSVTGAELDVTAAKDAFLPQLSAGASQSWSFGRGLTSENIYADRNTSQTGWNVSAELPLFQGLAAKRRLDLSRVNLRMYLAGFDRAKDDVTLNVITAYLQLLYTREVARVAELQRDLSAAEVTRRTELLDAGRIPELDLLEARSQLAQDEVQLVTALNDIDLARLDLTTLLRLPADPTFDVAPLTDDVDDILIPDPQTVYDNAMASLPAVTAGRLAVEAARHSVSVARTGYIPTLSFGTSVSSNYYTVSGIPNPSFSSQMRDNFNTYVGFTLRIPIFDAFTTRNNVRRANIELLNRRLDLDDTAHTLRRQIEQAYTQATAARRRYVSGLTALEATEAAFAAMQAKYDYGRATATEYDQAQTAYIQTRAEQVRNRYELLLRARILDFYNRQPAE